MGTKGMQTKEWIKQNSAQIFAQKGFCAVTMKDICEACGLSRGGLYRHYGSTRQIFEELLKEMSEADDGRIDEMVQEGLPARQTLEIVLNRLRDEILDQDHSLSYAIYEYSYVCENDFILELNRKAREKWRILLEYGIDQKEFPHMDVKQMTDVILYLYQGARMWSRIIPMEAETADHIIDKIRQDLTQ